MNGSVQKFVQSAWLVLTFQLVAAAVALIVTSWAAWQVQPLLKQREDLEDRVAELKNQRTREEQELSRVRAELKRADLELKTVSAELVGARASTKPLSDAIGLFYQRRYEEAIKYYDEALRLNPRDAYILNLKSYSQFKSGDFIGAAETIKEGLSLDPSYAWGYFDLARYQCAAGQYEEALASLAVALKSRGDAVRSLAPRFIRDDGEFRRFCKAVLPRMVDVLEERSTVR